MSEISNQANLSRRKLLKRTLYYAGGAAAVSAGVAAFQFDTYDLKVSHVTVPIKDLPKSFEGFRVAHLTDLHCRDYVRYDYLEKAMDIANALKPDLFALTGDYVSHERKDIPRVMKLIGRLKAECGLLSVLGNHDHWTDAEMSLKGLKNSGASDVTNTNVMISRGGDKICFAGVGDVWEDAQDIEKAYKGVPENMPRILLSHNPDYAEAMPDGYRTDLMICGHTHGGQVSLPFFGPPVVPSKYGKKYASGMIEGKRCRVYVSRGIGFIFKFRWNCPPELPVYKLTRA